MGWVQQFGIVGGAKEITLGIENARVDLFQEFFEDAILIDSGLGQAYL